MSRYISPRQDAQLAETFGRKPKHTGAELAALAEAEDVAAFTRLTSEVAALAVTRLGMSESAAVRHAEMAASDARHHAFTVGRIVGQSADPSSAHRHLQGTADKLRATVSLAAEERREPPPVVPVVPVVTDEQIDKVLAETFGRPGRKDRP